ncbi:hypothetical protein [Kribbella sp. NPDC051770]|uniref:hypothetical protein n=1 Tax=Kribbella sp. NPDC051770 TaxID=3155413 RepID=UPI003420DB70
MTHAITGGAAATLAEMLDERRHLLDVGVRILDSPVMAEKVIRETYRRWYAVDDDARAAIPAPRDWLTRVTAEICRELLPTVAQQQPTAPDNAMPPARPDQPRRLVLDQHTALVHCFAAACERGDATQLAALLADDAEMVIDGGGRLRAAIRPIRGAREAAEHIATLLAGQLCNVERVNDRAGLVLRRAGQAVGVVSLNLTPAAGTAANLAAAEVTTVWIVLNPDKLRNWQSLTDGRRSG